MTRREFRRVDCHCPLHAAIRAPGQGCAHLDVRQRIFRDFRFFVTFHIMSALQIHGIEIESRNNSESEISQMKEFVETLHKESPELCGLVERLFYDSNSSCCTFEFNSPRPDLDSEEMRSILWIARRHLVQFEWDGEMEHLEGPELE